MNLRPFVLRFDPSEIPRLAARYGYEQDDEAFSAGRRIAEGDYSRENLKVIVRWKSARKIAFIDDNTDAEIANALRFATNVRTSERSAVETLDRLHGVGVPMASAILTMIHPEKYTIIDVRALQSLGVNKWDGTASYYLDYLRECSALAFKHKVSLRTLDRALWQWSKENSGRIPAATQVAHRPCGGDKGTI
jgi:nucleoside-diphosphate-sugar epimerase